MTKELNSILFKSKNSLEYLSNLRKVKVVMGNESCDLDSTVTSLVYSLLLQQQGSDDTFVFPVINVKESDFPIKTDVNYFCKECGVETERFIFRDQVNLKALQDAGILEVVLVDHHTLLPKDEYLRSSVVEVIDHRPKDTSSLWSVNTELCIETVGSCSTLIARKALSTNPALLTPDIAKLLYGTFVLDTACLSPTAGIAQPLDFEIAHKLQKICSANAEEIFQSINTAKADISKLTTQQIINKDLKVVSGIPIIGLPILVHDFLQMPNAPVSVAKFCDENGYKLAVIMGLSVSCSEIERDISVYWHAQEMADVSVQFVNSLQENDFGLKVLSIPGLSDQFKVYKQTNVKFSRKKVLPIVRECTAKCH